MRTKRRLAAVAMLLCCSAAASAQQGTVQYHFDIGGVEFWHAFRRFAIDTGLDLIAPTDLLAGRQAPPLHGACTAEEALKALLQGTGLTFTHANGAIVITRSQDEGKYQKSAAANETTSNIVVTGTRIRGAGSASPVIATTRSSLEQQGVTDLDALTRLLPQNYTGGQNPGVAGGGEQGGQENINNSAALNLRGLGPDATLTLLNGHRLAYDGLDQGIDIAAIPLGAIDRVEVVADGASALYGSDAVGGVANIILRRDFRGLETTERLGASTDGGNVQQEYSAVVGQRWSTGGFMLALDHSRATPIYADQRSY